MSTFRVDFSDWPDRVHRVVWNVDTGEVITNGPALSDSDTLWGTPCPTVTVVLDVQDDR